MMKSSNLVGLMEGKEHDSSKKRDGGYRSSISSRGTTVEGINLHHFHLIWLAFIILGVLGLYSPSFVPMS